MNRINLHDIQEMANKYLDEYDVEHFELIINIEFSKKGLKSESQLKVSIDIITWQDVSVTQDYPVWILNFQGIAQPVDLLFSTEQTTEIVTDIINDLRSGFNLAQVSDKPTIMKVEKSEKL